MNRKQRRAQRAIERKEHMQMSPLLATLGLEAIKKGVELGIFVKAPDGGFITTEVGTDLIDGKIARSDRPDLYTWVDGIVMGYKIAQVIERW